MKTIGIRVNPSFVTYAVLDTDSKTVVVTDCINVPKALSTPDALKFVRSTLLDVLREYSVEKAGIRIAEHTQHSPSIDRIQIEGVVQEALASSTVLAYFVGQIASISAKANIERTDFKQIVAGDKDFAEVENWKEHSAEEREAILTAIGAQNA
ncbi:hypothetical protein R69927_05648 [Paraburkholderia domus]|jgi:hypothetical protein|uniref:hypothetical protein n=1 Tax=Paraburkholderia domus TaxID=2793075 RepID=UPI001913BFB5|nr:hypothetical protein [Paraburkholderia domus]MBK5050797.1 hypothetical protein [Burkholderia sp. R-70006]MBK5089876.1 hypothetical protein [Burkholderia sp. R-69927]CAE6766035.1 hypothetical protein R70006_03724 [Paraburkholderia domus]CAE6905491.1 hypothetical protein R69927_05648 [Paraburkholderia domus]